MILLRLLSALLPVAYTEAFAPSPYFRSSASTVLHSTLQSQSSTIQLDQSDDWIAKLDYDGFAKEVAALGEELKQNTGQADVEHLQKIVHWRNIAAMLGISTMWLPPNPITIVALSTWTYASWTMIAHHTCHGGYNRVDAGKFNSRGFALGSVKKRVEDWCDWMVSFNRHDMFIDHFENKYH